MAHHVPRASYIILEPVRAPSDVRLIELRPVMQTKLNGQRQRERRILTVPSGTKRQMCIPFLKVFLMKRMKRFGFLWRARFHNRIHWPIPAN